MADTNWIATASPIVHLGAKPVLVDILPDSWCIDPDKAEAAITPNTKAIVAVHLYGNLCDMDRLLAIGEKYGIPVIEDAAEAIGSVYHGKRAGSMGKFGSFSFHGTKTLTTGEGGMFVTNDADLFERVLTLSNHGRARGQTKQFWPDLIGFKYKMSNLQAAIGCAQMERIHDLIARKREILAFYRERLNGLSCISLNPEPFGIENGAWMPTVVFAPETGISREKLQAAFSAENIAYAVGLEKPDIHCINIAAFTHGALHRLVEPIDLEMMKSTLATASKVYCNDIHTTESTSCISHLLKKRLILLTQQYLQYQS
jgi:perosamine synthetase